MSQQDELFGTVLDGRYRIRERIGIGGMGVVYRATQLNAMERDVAIKMLNTTSLANDIVVKRFENEARAIALLRHPNTLKMIDSGRTTGGRLYIVTQFLIGESLEARLRRGPLGEEKVLAILDQVLGSIAEAHAHGIVHRDLKPANLFIEMVGSEEFVRVLDFGIAKLINQPGITAVAQVFGTPGYMAPEQIKGEVADARSDFYSLGAIAYECACGVPAYWADTPLKLIMKQLESPPVALTERMGRKVSRGLSELVARLMSVERDTRPQSVTEIRDAIAAMRIIADETAQDEPLAPGYEETAPSWDESSTDRSIRTAREAAARAAEHGPQGPKNGGPPSPITPITPVTPPSFEEQTEATIDQDATTRVAPQTQKIARVREREAAAAAVPVEQPDPTLRAGTPLPAGGPDPTLRAGTPLERSPARWRSVSWIAVPIAGAAIALALYVASVDRPEKKPPPSVDPVEAVPPKVVPVPVRVPSPPPSRTATPAADVEATPRKTTPPVRRPPPAAKKKPSEPTNVAPPPDFVDPELRPNR